jgi:hypothetical protein
VDPAQSAAWDLVSVTMATVYCVLPLRYEAGVLTIAMAADDVRVKKDLKSMLAVKRVDGEVWPADRIRKGIARDYAGRDDHTLDLLRRIGEGHT